MHSGQDGKGPCKAGERVCVTMGNLGVWGPCAGAVDPKPKDSCAVADDDSNCNGLKNEGCSCIAGAVSTCGSVNQSKGVCATIPLVCAPSGSWPSAGNCAPTKVRDCTSALDNDCDGTQDNKIDAACACVPGSRRVCGAHPGQDGRGPCTAGEQVCEGSGNTAIWGACTGSLGPKLSDRCDVAGDDSNCDGQPNGGCTCVSGDKKACGQIHSSKGDCAVLPLTCLASGVWPTASSCTTIKPEVCAADGKDENCDGQVNENCCTTRTCGTTCCAQRSSRASRRMAAW